jgi:hypothetical protein
MSATRRARRPSCVKAQRRPAQARERAQNLASELWSKLSAIDIPLTLLSGKAPTFWISFHAAPPHGHLPPSERQSCHSHQSLFERDNADSLRKVIISFRSRGTAKVISMLMQGDPTSAAPSGRSAVSDFFQRCFRLRSGNFKPKVRAQSRALHLPLRPCFPHRGFARCLSLPMPFCA